MAIFNVTAVGNYLIYRNIARLHEDALTWFSNQGILWFSANPYTDNPNLFLFGFKPINGAEQPVTQIMCNSFMAQHDNSIPTKSQLLNQTIENAEIAANNISGWATWNETSALTWLTANVQTYLDALPPDITTMNSATFNNNNRAFIGSLHHALNGIALAQRRQGQLLIAIRNRLWPNLQE